MLYNSVEKVNVPGTNKMRNVSFWSKFVVFYNRYLHMIHILNPMYTVEKDVAFYTTCLWKQSRKDRMRYRIILWEVIAKKKTHIQTT